MRVLQRMNQTIEEPYEEHNEGHPKFMQPCHSYHKLDSMDIILTVVPVYAIWLRGEAKEAMCKEATLC